MFQISALFGEIMESSITRKSGDLMHMNNQENSGFHQRNDNNKDDNPRKSTDELPQPDSFGNNDLTDISLDIFAQSIPRKDAFVNKEYEAGPYCQIQSTEIDDDAMDDILCQAVDAVAEQMNRNKVQSKAISPLVSDEEKLLSLELEFDSTGNDSDVIPCGQKIVDKKSQTFANSSRKTISGHEMSSHINNMGSIFSQSQCGADINRGERGVMSNFLEADMQQNIEESFLRDTSDEDLDAPLEQCYGNVNSAAINASTSHKKEQSQLVFSHAFKKKVVMYATKHRSKTKASRQYGIPFETVGVWIKKVNKGVPESVIKWPKESEPEEEYTQRFKSAIVEYVRKRRCSLEFAAEAFGLDPELIRCWRDDANKVRRESVISNIVSPVILENLGLALEDIRRRRKIECVDNPEDYSDDFISTVVRYIKRRKCAIDRASKTLEIDADVLRRWIQADRYNQKCKETPANKAGPDLASVRTTPAVIGDRCRNISGSPSQDSDWFGSATPRPLSYLLGTRQKPSNSHLADSERREKHRLMASQYRNFHYFKGAVIDHVRKSKRISATATHFDIPSSTVYAWSEQAGLQLQEEPPCDESYSDDFVESVRTFIKRRKCSSKYAGGLFHIDPDLITNWRKQATTKASVKRYRTRDRSGKRRSRGANDLSQSQDENFREAESVSEILEDEILRDKDADPDNFEDLCRELFPSGQGASRYSLPFRIEVMRDLVLKNVGVTEAAKRYGMPRRTVYDWLLKWTELKAKARNDPEKSRSSLDIDLLATRINRNQRRVADSNGSLTTDNSRWRDLDLKNGFSNLIDVIEDRLQTWIVEQISLSRQVTERAVKHQAMKYASEIGEPDFVPINEWCATFLSKTGLADSVASDNKHSRNSIAKSTAGNAKMLSNEQVAGKRTPAFKLSVIEYAQNSGNAAASRRFDISESTIRSWRKAEPKLRKEAALEAGDDTPKRHTVSFQKNDDIAAEDTGDTDLDFRPPRRKRKLEVSSKLSKTKAKSAGLFRGSALGHSTRLKIISYARRHGSKSAASFFKVTQDDIEYWLGESGAGSSQTLSGPGKESILALRRQQFRSRIANFARRKGVDSAVKNFKVSAKYIRKWMNNEFPASENNAGASDRPTAAVELKTASTQTHANSNSCLQSHPIEPTKAFFIAKSSSSKFQDVCSSRTAPKRKFYDSASTTGQEFSLEMTKYANICDSFSSGLEVKREFFYLDQDYVFLNHGGRGSTLVKSLEFSHLCHRQVETRPQSFFKKRCPSWMKHLRKRFACFVGSEQNNVSFIDTVRSGMDSILDDLRLSQSCSIYYLSFSSDETKDAIRNVCEKTGSRCQEEMLLLPLQNHDDILSVISETLDEETTLAVFDHSPVDYGFILPIKEIVLLCHMKGVPVLINGSHGFGQEPLNLSYVAPDYYVGSCDRWLCSANSCSFVYRKKGIGDLKNGESRTETDYSSQDPRSLCSRFAVLSSLNFWESMGFVKICEYSRSLLRKAVQLFQSQWDADLLAPVDMNGMMCCVSLPAPLYANRKEELSTISSVIKQQLYNDYKLDTAIICIQSKLYLRISTHIYNEFSDYEKLANAIVEMEADCM